MRWSATSAVVGLLLVAGCTADDGASPEEPEPAGTSAGAAPSAAAPAEDSGDGGVAASPAGEVPAEPVAVVPGQDPGMVLEVYRLARTGGTATLTMGVLNDGDEELSLLTSFQAGQGAAFDASGISLLDPVNLDRYLVLRDTEDECLCSRLQGGDFRPGPGERVHLSASFPAPPDDVTSVTVETPAGSLADVPITEGS